MQRTIIATALGLVLAFTAVYAADVEDVVNASQEWLVAQRQSQQKIDELASKASGILAEYQSVLRQVEGLEAYNNQLRELIDQQKTEIARTQDSLARASRVDRQLLPLLHKMVQGYVQLVEASMPFLPEKRQNRIDFLKKVVARADVSAAEKFRQVLETYMTAMGYGSSIGTYNDVITINGAKRPVAVLRLGRIGLYYQTPDRAYTGRWSEEKQKWVPLPSGYRNRVYHAIRVAKKMTAPSLLSLPLPQPVDASANTGSSRADAGLDALARLAPQEAQ